MKKWHFILMAVLLTAATGIAYFTYNRCQFDQSVNGRTVTRVGLNLWGTPVDMSIETPEILELGPVLEDRTRHGRWRTIQVSGKRIHEFEDAWYWYGEKVSRGDFESKRR